MAPLVRPGAALAPPPVPPAPPRAAALVGYRRADRLVVHRVLARRRAFVVTKGDALGDPDPPVAWEDVVGRVVALRTPAGRRGGPAGVPSPLLGRGAATLPLDTKVLRGLNAVGSRVWELIDGRRSVADIVAAVVREFDVPPEAAGADVDAFVRELLARGLVTA